MTSLILSEHIEVTNTAFNPRNFFPICFKNTRKIIRKKS
jgi:hypothetical protein